MRFFNFGSLNVDYVYKVNHIVKGGETLGSDSLSIGCGGKGLNQSIALSRAGASVYHVGLYGQSGEILRNELEDSGVALDYLKYSDTPNGHAIIQVDYDGQNSIVLFGGTNRMLSTDLIDEAVSRMLPGDVALLQNEINNIDYIITEVSKKGCDIVMNIAPMDNSVFSYPLDKLSMIVANEVEAEGYTGESNPDKMIEKFLEKFPQAKILLTLGALGSVYADRGEKVFVESNKVELVDTTGAGDTYLGYFLSCYYNGMPVLESMKIATDASSICISRKGASKSIPVFSEVEKMRT